MGSRGAIQQFIRKIPKAELHVHIEGTFEPELMLEIAKRNSIPLKYTSVGAIRKAYRFSSLQNFLDIYYEGCKVLLHERDFYDLTAAYLKRAHEQNVLHTEIFFDPQTHTNRGVAFSTIVTGIHAALKDASKRWGTSGSLIMCFLRHLSPGSAMKTLEEALQFKDSIIGVGLDSSELGNPPSKFSKVFDRARSKGFLTVAHAGEEGPAEYVREALGLLKISRVDHGNRSLDDESLVAELVRRRMPLTVCPLSNLKLAVVDSMENHPLKRMLDLGLFVTFNSDDPAYFGGYVTENYLAMQEALHLDKGDIIRLARNSFEASFLSVSEKRTMLAELDRFVGKERSRLCC